jgi:hypothetical protein
METLLRSTDTLQPIASNYEAAKATARLDASGAFVPPVPGTANFAQLDKRFRIERGRSYLLDFSFPQGSATRGVIEIAGRTFHREYALPEYGGSKAFGAGGDHRSLVPLSTSSPTPVDLTLRYFPESAQPADPVIRVRFLEYDPSALPIRLESLIPYRVLVKSPAAAWLETPRMHQVGYIAMANGHPTALRRSPDGLTWIAIPAGESQVELLFKPPLGLQVLFWVSLLSIGAAAGTAFAAGARRLRGLF